MFYRNMCHEQEQRADSINKKEKTDNNETNQITIVDVKMPFLSMMVFMVKAAIASIPAFIIFATIGAIVIAILWNFWRYGVILKLMPNNRFHSNILFCCAPQNCDEPRPNV
jgi:hypothetical protein